jgi:transposase
MVDVDTSGAKRRRKHWPEEVKREIVAASLAPGASVSVVARQYDVNANQVFSWRRRFCGAAVSPLTSSLSPVPSALKAASRLVPVTITPEPDDKAASMPSAPGAAETIEIEVPGGTRVRVGAGFDSQALKRVLDLLRQR